MGLWQIAAPSECHRVESSWPASRPVAISRHAPDACGDDRLVTTSQGRGELSRSVPAGLRIDAVQRAPNPALSDVTPISRETRIGTSERWSSATRCCKRLSAIVIRARSRTYSAHDAIT